jgi:hypothetical protein
LPSRRVSDTMYDMGDPRGTLEPEWRRAATPSTRCPYVRYARKAALTEREVFYSGYSLKDIPSHLERRVAVLRQSAIDLRRDRSRSMEWMLVAYGPDDDGVLASCASDRWADVYAASMKWQQKKLSASVLGSLGVGSNQAVERLSQLF